MPKPSDESETEDNAAYSKFEKLTRDLLAVPKHELDKARDKQKKRKAKA